jgi:thiosulfate/3-mercaptopyruvate sulfurtransferase
MSSSILSSLAVSMTGFSIVSQQLLRIAKRQFVTVSKTSSALVNGEWLEPRIRKVRVFDATWFIPNAQNAKKAELDYIEKRIPTAQRFDLDLLSDPKEKDLPHMLPPFEWFGAKMDEFGVSPLDEIVVYDAIGQFSAARAFWTLKVLGGKQVKLLDGGLPVWLAENRKIESGPVANHPKPNAPGTWAKLTQPMLSQVIKVETVEKFAENALNNKENATQLVDARPKNRFLAIDPEPRAGLKKGKIPGSLNMPFKELLNDNGTFKDVDKIKSAFETIGVDTSGKTKVITSCGSGTTAAILTFALNELLGVDAPLYDGSFAEYGKLDAKRVVL